MSKTKLNIIFRKTEFYLITSVLVILAISSCKSRSDNDRPENAIDPSVINNPTTASSTKSKDDVPVIKFEKETHDFGTVTEGEKVSFAFNFKNVGKSDLVIRAAQGSCGCTVPEFPKDAIKPGDSGIINVTFNSAGKEGHQNKSIDIISNTMPNVVKIYVTGDVIKAEK